MDIHVCTQTCVCIQKVASRGEYICLYICVCRYINIYIYIHMCVRVCLLYAQLFVCVTHVCHAVHRD